MHKYFLVKDYKMIAPDVPDMQIFNFLPHYYSKDTIGYNKSRF